MGQRLTADDFNQLWRYFRHEAFRLECQPVYLVDVEREPFAEFLRGEPRPAPEIPYYAAWLDQIHAVTSQGRRVARVRILEEPPTDYQRWEIWAGQYNIAAGEDIRYLNRSQAVEVGLPVAADWWLFDSERLALMRFSPDGTPLGGEIIDDPEVVAQHCTWRDLAVSHSAPSPQCATA